MFVKGIKIDILAQHRERAKKQGFRPLTIHQYFVICARIMAC